LKWQQAYADSFDVGWTNGIRPSGYAELHQMVMERVSYMIEKTPNDFFNMLYLLDIDESKIQNALIQTDPCHSIAEIIIEREIEKIESRKAYKHHFDNAIDDEAEKW